MRALGLLVVIMLSSCGFKYHDSISGNGQVESRLVTTDTIREVVVSDKIDVVLIPSDSSGIVLRADKNLMNVIRVMQNGSKIEFYCDKLIRMARAKEVQVYGSFVNQLDMASKCMLSNTDSLQYGELSITLGAGASVDLSGSFDSLSIETGAGCSVTLSGKSAYTYIYAVGGTDVEAYKLVSYQAVINSISASNVDITITDKAYLYASSFADIRYRGNPVVLESRELGLADIKQKP